MQTTRFYSRLNVFLGVLILVLVNLVGTNAYLRLDLTHNNAYSLSQVSRETLARVEDPLRIKVFYNAEVPAPYNGVRQYLMDMLREYDNAEGRYFSYEVIDPTTDAGKQEAQRYGLQQVEIQEIQSDQFASRAVYLGAVVLYGNVVERVDRITSTDGLEYRLTTAMRSAITQVDALSGTSEQVAMDVLASPTLGGLQIQGFQELQTQMTAIHERVNADNYGRIDFAFHTPASDSEIRQFAREYGVEPVRWQTQDGAQHQGLLEIVLTLGDRVERIPLQIYSGLFGGYSLGDPADIEDSVREGLRSLVSANPRIAYSTTAGEKDPADGQRGAAPFAQLVGESYELVNVNLDSDSVPADIDTLVINGPTQQYSDAALYRIDQFVMRGGSVMMFVDRHVQNVPTRQQMAAGAQPTWDFNDTGLSRLLQTWGVRFTDQVVLDEESYIARQQSGARQQLYQAPIIQSDGFNRDNVVTAGLEDVIVLNATEILPYADTDAAAGSDTTTSDGASGEGSSADGFTLPDVVPNYVPLLSTSRKSWVVASPSEVGPWISGAPQDSDTAPRNVAVLLTGDFTSAFDQPVDLGLPSRPRDGDAGAAESDVASSAGTSTTAAATSIAADRYRATSVEPAKVIVVSTSALTTPQMLDPQNRTPNGTFLMNAVDYLNGAPGIAELRSKGLGVARLSVANPASRVVARWGNTILVPALVLVVGLVVWSRRRARARRIQAMFDNTSEDAS